MGGYLPVCALFGVVGNHIHLCAECTNHFVGVSRHGAGRCDKLFHVPAMTSRAFGARVSMQFI